MQAADDSSCSGEFGAIVLDTNIYVRYKYGFEYGNLAKMQKFKNGNVKFLMPLVVYNEVVKHYKEYLEGCARSVKDPLKMIKGHFGVDVETVNAILKMMKVDDCDRLSTEAVGEYIEKCGCDRLNSDSVRIGEILNEYFCTLPPFGNCDNKKCEFPDAIALHTIDDWASFNKLRVLVVSDDKGWSDFCENNERLCCVDDLPQAYNILITQQWPKEFADGFAEFLIGIRRDEFKETVLRALDEQFDGHEVEVEAFSSYNMSIDAEGYVKNCKDLSFILNGDDRVLFYVTDVDEASISLSCSVIVTMDVNVDFEMAVWDSVDRESIPISSRTHTVDQDVDVDLTIILYVERNSTDFRYEDIEFDVECDPVGISVEIGDVSPFDDDEYYDE